MHRFLLRMVAVVMTTLLEACGGDGGSDGRSAAASGPHNEADVGFATDMVSHHAQALQLVDLAEQKGASGGFEQLLDDIADSQGAEIEQMSGWLEGWGEDVPASDAPMGAMDMGGAGAGAATLPGMVGAESMQRLEAASGPDFRRLWLRLMIEHHEGAVQMARVQLRQGESPEAVALAESIIEAQRDEIELMEDLGRR